MAAFDLHWRAFTKKDLRNLPRAEVARIIDAVSKLADEPLPHGCQKFGQF